VATIFALKKSYHRPAKTDFIELTLAVGGQEEVKKHLKLRLGVFFSQA